jgi:hypothetical protein
MEPLAAEFVERLQRGEADLTALHRAGDPDPGQAAQAFLHAARDPDLGPRSAAHGTPRLRGPVSRRPL